MGPENNASSSSRRGEQLHIRSLRLLTRYSLSLKTNSDDCHSIQSSESDVLICQSKANLESTVCA